MKKAFRLLKEKQLTISIAESMTGGLISYSIAKNPGASKVLKGSIVAYTEEVKKQLLNVDNQTILKNSIVSKEVAKAMIDGLKVKISSDIYVSVTGNAGPTYEKNTSTLECYIGVFFKGDTEIIHHKFNSNYRAKNIKKTLKIINNKIIEKIEKV